MNPMDRREFLKLGGALAGALTLPAAVEAQGEVPSFDDAYAVLYDATRCVGCRSCMRRCREVNHLPADPGEINGVAFDMPTTLSERNGMVIQAYVEESASGSGQQRWSFVKKNCMHCNAPACVSACPVAALKKTARGPVLYEEDRCIGCRYCMLACPYGVPRYEWMDRAPRVRKCDLNGACVQACPTGALTDGTRRALIAEAHRRIEREPQRYVDHVYGEHEGGGTSYLLLSAVPFEKLGLPKLSASAPGHFAEPILRTVPGWVAGLALFLGALHQLQRKPRSSDVEAAVPASATADQAEPVRERESIL